MESSAATREITCPVCRARQQPQRACRRCGADLSLYLKALQSIDHLRQRYSAARRSGDDESAARALRYLRWLKPRDFT